MALGNETNHTLDGLTVEGGLLVKGQLTASSLGVPTGGGENQLFYSGLGVAAGSVAINQGFAVAPNALLQPTFKVSRLQEVKKAALTAAFGSTDGCEVLASIYGINVGTTANEVQPIGVMGAAKASNNGPTGNDACGVYGAAEVSGASDGTAIGAFLTGRRVVDTGRATALELAVQNYTATAGTYSTVGYSDTTGIWVVPLGNSDSAVGMVVGNPFGYQFDVGLAFNAQVTGGKTGGVKTTSIRDDSSSVTSINIRGTHTQSIGVAAGAGPVVFGANTSSGTGSVLEIVAPTGSTTNLVNVGTTSGSDGFSVRFGNGAGTTNLFVCASNGTWLTGTIAADTGFFWTATKTMHFGRSGSRGTLRLSDNVAIGQQADSVGGGVGVVFIANAGTVPSSNPTAGGILYTEAGALKFRGSSGTVSTVAPA